MEQLSESATPPSAHNLTHQEVDNLLLSSKKVRYRNRKACYPCNKRKIRCDRDDRQPCTNCRKRPHPELCSYEDPEVRSSTSRTPQTSRSVQTPSGPPHSPVDQTSQSLRQVILPGVRAASPMHTNSSDMQIPSGPIGLGFSHSPAGSSGDGYINVPPSGRTPVIPRAPKDSMVSPMRTHPRDYDKVAPRTVSPPLGRKESSGTFSPSHSVASWLPPQKHILRYSCHFNVFWSLCSPLPGTSRYTGHFAPPSTRF